MANSTQVLNNLFVQKLAPGVKDTIFQKSWFYRLIQKTKGDKVNAKGVEMSVRTKESASYGARPEGGTLPMPDSPGFEKMQLGFKMEYAAGEVTGVAMMVDDVDANVSGESNLLGFAGALAKSLEFETDDFIRKLNRHAYGTGNGAITSPITAVTTGTNGTFTVNPNLLTGTEGIIVGARIQFFTNGGVQHSQSGAVPVSIVTAKDDATGMVTCNSIPSDAATGDVPVWENSYGLVPNGLRGIIQDGNITFQNLNVTGLPNLKGDVYDAAGDPLDFKMVDKRIVKLQRKTNMTAPVNDFTFITNPIQKTALKKFIYDNGTIQQSTNMYGEKVNLGLQDVTINGMNVNLDNDSGKSEFFGLRLKSLKRIAIKEPGLLKLADSYLILKQTSVAPAHAFNYYFCHVGNLGTDDPGANFRIKNLDTAAVI